MLAIPCLPPSTPQTGEREVERVHGLLMLLRRSVQVALLGSTCGEWEHGPQHELNCASVFRGQWAVDFLTSSS